MGWERMRVTKDMIFMIFMTNGCSRKHALLFFSSPLAGQHVFVILKRPFLALVCFALRLSAHENDATALGYLRVYDDGMEWNGCLHI